MLDLNTGFENIYLTWFFTFALDLWDGETWILILEIFIKAYILFYNYT